MGFGVSIYLGAGYIEKRPAEPAFMEGCNRGHGGQSAGSRPADQLEKYGFRLVTLVVGSEQYVPLFNERAQQAVTSLAGDRFHTLPWPYLQRYAPCLQGDIEITADCFAVPLPIFGLRLQTMVHMDGDYRRRQPVAQRCEGMKKNV